MLPWFYGTKSGKKKKKSRLLHTIFEEASNVIKEEYTNANQVVFAKVDCDQHADITQRYRISKYTTFKSLHNGKMMKRRYRGSDKRKNLQITSGNKKVTPSRTS